MSKCLLWVLNLSGLCALWYMSIKDNNINYIILIPALAIAWNYLVWNALTDNSKVKVKADESNDLEKSMLKMRVALLENIIRTNEVTEKISNSVIRDLQEQVKRLECKK